MLCCSNDCKIAMECALHYSHNSGTHQVADFSRCGAAKYSDEGVEYSWECGELGKYKMFEPIANMDRQQELEIARQLRELTGAGTLCCLKALQTTNYDFDKAILYMKIMPQSYLY